MVSGEAEGAAAGSEHQAAAAANANADANARAIGASWPLDTAAHASASAAQSCACCPQPTASAAEACAALASVVDPELPFLTIAELGILREVRLAADSRTIEVVITPTYSGCPANDVIALDIATALARAGIAHARVVTQRAPAWTTDWISGEGRAKLAANGIAPPPPASGKRALFAADPIACPHCGAADAERVSAFGSTACKSHYRCRACREPFEAFKCI